MTEGIELLNQENLERSEKRKLTNTKGVGPTTPRCSC